jgi:tetratricopeptide (TPR) repeat protein
VGLRAQARNVTWLGSMFLVLATTVALFLLPFRETAFVVVVVYVLGLLACRPGRGIWPGIGHVLAIIVVLAFSAETDQVHDYYKYWGGTSRRLGDEAGKKAAYSKLVKISPWYAPGHYRYGLVLESEGKLDEALAQYVKARELSPTYWRAWLAEAVIHHKQRRGEEALYAARRALLIQPNSRSARRIEQVWAARLGR